MEKKDIFVEMEKAKNLIKSRIDKGVDFSPFVIAYTVDQGNKLVELEPFTDAEDKNDQLTNMVKWLKEQHSYAFLFGSLASKKKFQTVEDMEQDKNFTLTYGALIVGKTPDKTYHMSIEASKKDGKIEFQEHFSDMTNDNGRSFLNEVYEDTN